MRKPPGWAAAVKLRFVDKTCIGDDCDRSTRRRIGGPLLSGHCCVRCEMGPSYGHGYDCAGLIEMMNFTPPPLEDVLKVLDEDLQRHPYGRGEVADRAMSCWLLGIPFEVSVELVSIDDESP